MAGELTDKQQKFCDEYLIDFNGTQAAIRAGCANIHAQPSAGLYYVYCLIDPRDDSIFYIGKGVRDRALHHEREYNLKELVNYRKCGRIKEIHNAGKKVKIIYIANSVYEWEAYKMEHYLISRLKNYGLTNITGAKKQTDAERAEYIYKKINPFCIWAERFSHTDYESDMYFRIVGELYKIKAT